MGVVGGIRAEVEAAVARAIAAHALWPADATLVVGVSGGADSLCLLGTLQALRERGHPLAPAALVVAHLDHGLRGAEGAADARFVADLAVGLGLRCMTERVDTRALARARRRSLEDAARRARYAFLRRAASAVGAVRICVGHTRDDQVETLVLHWLRGSGLAGLAGMPPLARDVARPLLALTGAQTVAYCAARGWAPREDPSNADLRFLRNRVRHALLPELERYNPNLRANLIRNAALLAADEAFLEAQTEAAWRSMVAEADGEAIAVDLAGLHLLPLALRHRIYRRVASRLCGEEQPLEARHIARLDALLDAGHGGDVLDLPSGLRVMLGYTALTFARRAVPRAHAAGTPSGRISSRELSVPGAVDLPETGWRIRAWIQDTPSGIAAGDVPPAPELPAFAHAGDAGQVGHAATRAYLAYAREYERLTVRTWRPGDRFRPLGMAAEKKLQDYFTDAKVPRPLRARLPLVFGPDHLLWVAGLRIDDRAKLAPETRRMLVLQLEPLSGE